MKTHCPTCKTRYDISPQALLEADGVARCFRCGTVFDAVAEDAAAPGVTYSAPVHSATALDEQAEISPGVVREPQNQPTVPEPGQEVDPETQTAEPIREADRLSTEPLSPAQADEPADPSDPPQNPLEDRSESQLPGLVAPSVTPLNTPDPKLTDTSEDPLPFDVPDNLAPLEPSPEVALDVTDTLYEKKSRRGFFYGLVTLLLIAGLGLQLAWQHRKDLLDQYPVLQPLCEYIECVPSVVHAPKEISVLQRDIKPARNQPGALTLSATMRNDADIAQTLPDIQLSLLDNNGAVLVRRRLAPADYLFPAPPKEKVMAPGEVITITLDFEDPGHQASGFVINFL